MRLKRLTAVLALLATSAPVAADPLLYYNGRLFIDARVNGVPTEALLDSAAEGSLVDPAFAVKAKLPEGTAQTIRGSGGEAKARIVEGVTVEVLGLKLHPDALVITDLSELSKRLIKRPTMVVIGRDLFDAARLRIDIAAGRIDTVTTKSEPTGVRLELTEHAGVESMPVTADGERVQAEFDLGNGSKPLISRALANRLHLKTIAHELGGGIGGPLMHDIVVLKRLDVAGVRFRNVGAAIDDQSNANDLNLGTSVLKRFLITTDFSRKAVWLKPRMR
jgi:Aspartyl protease